MFLKLWFQKSAYKDFVTVVNTYVEADIELKNIYQYLVDTCKVEPSHISIFSYDTDMLVQCGRGPVIVTDEYRIATSKFNKGVNLHYLFLCGTDYNKSYISIDNYFKLTAKQQSDLYRNLKYSHALDLNFIFMDAVYNNTDHMVCQIECHVNELNQFDYGMNNLAQVILSHVVFLSPVIMPYVVNGERVYMREDVMRKIYKDYCL